MGQPKRKMDKRAQLSQSDFPIDSLMEAIRVSQALTDHFAGHATPPHDIAMALELSPTGSQWRMLAGCALAYGLTTGSFSADRIGLSELGKRITAPTSEGDDHLASMEALLRPRILKEFFQKYDKSKFPRDDIAKNVLEQMGIPRDRLNRCLEILIQNGKKYGLIRETKTGLFVALETTTSRPAIIIPIESGSTQENEDTNILPFSLDTKKENETSLNNRVFISHGKNRKILDQLKTVIAYGNFEPIVSVDNETISKPLSDKVLDDMRSCAFAVIHIEDEKLFLTPTAKPTSI